VRFLAADHDGIMKCVGYGRRVLDVIVFLRESRIALILVRSVTFDRYSLISSYSRIENILSHSFYAVNSTSLQLRSCHSIVVSLPWYQEA
jgi:hypothetical protein